MVKLVNTKERKIISLDLKDKKILSELDKNARENISRIARNINCSKQTTCYRLCNLIKSGVIKKFLTIMDTEKLGYSFYNLYLQIEGMDKKTETEFCSFITNYYSVDWFVTGHGKWNYIISVLAKNNKEFNQSAVKILDKAGLYLKDHALFIVTEAHQLPYNYLFTDMKTKQGKSVYIGENKNLKYDNLDFKILQKLTENARINNMDIAKTLNISRNQVKYKINKMEESGLIQAYRPLLDLNKLGYEWFVVFLNLKNLNQKEEKEFTIFLKSMDYINYIVKGIGEWNLIIELHTKNINHFNEIMGYIIEKYPNIIKNYEYSYIQNEYKCNFFPQAILRE